MEYPESRREDLVENLHGRLVPDPYRWLEDPDSEATRAWVEAQRRLTERYLDQLPERAWFQETLNRVISRPRAGVPRIKGGWCFLNRNDGSQAHDVWYVARSVAQIHDPQARVIADPNTWSTDHTSSLMLFTVSGDGRYLAEAVSEGGSDWQRIRIVEVATGERVDEPDLVTKFATPTWLPDGRSYLYNAFADTSHAVGTETGHLGRPRVMRHVLGTDQAEDQVICELDDERMLFDWEVTDDDHWLCLRAGRGTENRNLLWVYPLTDAGGLTQIGERIDLVRDLSHEFLVVGSVGAPGQDARLVVQTDQGAAQRSPAIATALFTCTARFFPDPRWNLQPTQPQLELVWDYTHRFLIPCLRSHQVRVPDPPTEQRWVKSGGRGWDYPDLSGNPDREQIIRHCLPTVPSAWYLGDRQE